MIEISFSAQAPGLPAGAPTTATAPAPRRCPPPSVRWGSWPGYYDSQTLFSPARYSGIPGMPFPGDPDRYPTRDEVAAYLQNYAGRPDVEIRTDVAVSTVEAASFKVM